MCCLMFLLGIPMVSQVNAQMTPLSLDSLQYSLSIQGGAFIFQLMDFYSASGMSLLFVCFFQTIAISWIFGASNFTAAIHEMMGIRLNRFWSVCWVFCAPGIMAVRYYYSHKLSIVSFCVSDDFYILHRPI